MSFLDTKDVENIQTGTINIFDGIIFSFNELICGYHIEENNFYYLKGLKYVLYEELNDVFSNENFSLEDNTYATFVELILNDNLCLCFGQNVYVVNFENKTYEKIVLPQPRKLDFNNRLQNIQCENNLLYYFSNNNTLVIYNTTDDTYVETIINAAYTQTDFIIYNTNMYSLLQNGSYTNLVKINTSTGFGETMCTLSNEHDATSAKGVVYNSEIHWFLNGDSIHLKYNPNNDVYFKCKSLSSTFDINNHYIIPHKDALCIIKNNDNTNNIIFYTYSSAGIQYDYAEKESTFFFPEVTRLNLTDSTTYDYLSNGLYDYTNSNDYKGANRECTSIDNTDYSSYTVCYEYEYNGHLVQSAASTNAYIFVDGQPVVDLKYAVDGIICFHEDYVYFYPKEYHFPYCTIRYTMFECTLKIQRLKISTSEITTIWDVTSGGDIDTTLGYYDRGYKNIEYSDSLNFSGDWYIDHNRALAYQLCVCDYYLAYKFAYRKTYTMADLQEHQWMRCLNMNTGEIKTYPAINNNGDAIIPRNVFQVPYYTDYPYDKLMGEETIVMFNGNLIYVKISEDLKNLAIDEYDLSSFNETGEFTYNEKIVKISDNLRQIIPRIKSFSSYFMLDNPTEEYLVVAFYELTYGLSYAIITYDEEVGEYVLS